MRLALAALVLLACAAAAQDFTSTQAEETDPVVIELRDRLKNDPNLIEVVAQRVSRSQLIGMVTSDQDQAARVAAAKDWIAKDPDSAARVAIGLTHDDQVGKPEYEDNLLKQMGKTYEDNPGAQKNLFFRLKKNAKDSKLLKKQTEDMSADEQREVLRTLFEGQGAESGKVISGKDQQNGRIPDKGGVPATSFNGIYDRLGAGNLRGYSPQLLSLQSALNSRRPPGAPPLIETGKLDFATLSYPAYGMKFDVGNLDARLRRDRLMAYARLAGRTLTARDLNDPDLEEKLSRQIPSDKLSPRLKKAAELSARANAALAAFLAAAQKAKLPNGISRALLIELGQKQKETARWITAAAVEEELARLEPLEAFPSAELIAAIAAAPAPAPERESYRRRADGLKSKVAAVKAGAQNALDLLESDAWAGALAQVDKLLADNREVKANLGRDIDDLSRTPFRIAEARLVQPRWRDILDDLAVKWAPTLPYSRAVAFRRGRLTRLLGVFSLIAAGDANAAHNALVNETGGR